MGAQPPPVLLLQLRQLDRFLKRQGLHSAARTLETASLVYFDAAHLQKLVRDGRWEAAGSYLRRFSQLWEGEGTGQQFTAFQHTLENHTMLHFLACRGDEGGRAASSLFCCDDDAFRSKFPEIAERHDLYRSMASEQSSVMFSGFPLVWRQDTLITQVESIQDRKILIALELHSNILIQQNVSKGHEWLELFLSLEKSPREFWEAG